MQLTPIALSLTRSGTVPYTPASLFAANEPGVWYDIDPSYMYQDSAGTTPVTAVEQPVGLVLDRSRGLVLGSELVTNGTFDGGSSAGWVFSATHSFVFTNNRMEVVSGLGGSPYADVVGISLVAGKTYLVEFDLVIAGGSYFGGGLSNVGIPSFSSMGAPGRKSYRVVAINGPIRVIGPSPFAIDNISVKELPGAHAYQTTSASRPVYSRRYNLLTATNTLSTQNVTTVATSYTLKFEGTGTVTLSGTSTGTLSAGSNVFTPTAGTLTLTVSGTVTNAQLTPTNQASLPYQSVTNSTNYDADPSKFPAYLRADGSDDFLITPTITPGTDKAQIFAGVRKLSDAATAIFVEFSSSSSNAGMFYLAAPEDVSTKRYATLSRGSASAGVGQISYSTDGAAPDSAVLSAQLDIAADRSILRRNAVSYAAGTGDQGTGNYLAYPLYLFRRGGTTLPFNGQCYGLVVRFGANLTTAQIQAAERYMASKTGITL